MRENQKIGGLIDLSDEERPELSLIGELSELFKDFEPGAQKELKRLADEEARKKLDKIVVAYKEKLRREKLFMAASGRRTTARRVR